MSILKRVRPSVSLTAAQVLKHASPSQRRQLRRLAKRHRGLRVVHLNATPIGGGPAEMFKTFIPSLRALGIRAEWYVIDPSAGQRFFDFFDTIRNSLQGIPIRYSAAGWKEYVRVNRKIAEELNQLPYDVLVVHDPQPLWAGLWLDTNRPRIYVNHLDTSEADPSAWKRFLPPIRTFDMFVFSNRSFIHAGLPKTKTHVIPPAIDPNIIKQKIVPRPTARRYLQRYHVPANGPLILQVSRFDVWKNPLGLIQAFHIVHQAYPNARLALVGLKEAKDNGDAENVYRDVMRVAEEHKNIHLFFEPLGIPDIAKFTMLAQNAADMIVQNSIKEGFGLTVTEAMWKHKPVIGGPAPGIRLQIQHNQNGLIAKNDRELARELLRLLKHPKLRRRLGRAGRASVTRRFLMSRLLLDHLRLYDQLR